MAGLNDVIAHLSVVLSLDQGNFALGSTQAQKQLAKMREAVTGLADKWTDAGKRMSARITLPIGGVLAGVVKVAGDFEGAMIKVGISTQGTAAEMEAMRKVAIKLGADTTFGATEAADAMDMLAKNGLTAKQILGGAADAAVNLATAAGSELAPAADAITDVMAQFKITTEQLPRVVDQITGAVNESKLDFADFTLAIGQAGGVAGAVGVSFEDFNAVIAGTSSLFASGSDAGTSFKTFLTTLPGKSSPAAAAIEELGLQFYRADGSLRSMGEIAQELRDKLSGLSDVAKQDALTTIFGTDAMRTAVGLMDQGAAGIERIQKAIAATDAAGQAATRMQGFTGQLDNLKGALESLAIAIADTGLLTAVTKLVTVTANFISYVAQANPFVMKLAVGVAVLAAAMGPLMIVTGLLASTLLPLFLLRLGPLALGISALINPLGTAVTLLGSLALRFGAIPAILGTLVPLLVSFAAPLAAVAAGGYLIYKNWDQVREAFAPLAAELRAVGEGLGLVQKQAGATNEELAKTEGYRELGRQLRTVSDQINTVFGEMDRATSEFGLSIYRNFTVPAGRAMGEFFTALESGAFRIGVAIRSFVDNAGAYIDGLTQRIHAALVGRLGAIWNTVESKVETVRVAFFKLYDAVVGHSYVPDMVDGIAAQMQRLDAVMVKPATGATTAVSNAMRTMAAETQALLDRLFPEVRKLLDYRADLAKIDTSSLPADQQTEARRRLGIEYGGGGGAVTPDIGGLEPLIPSMDDVQRRLERLTTAANDNTVRIAKSFKDMADETLGSLSRLTGSIKSGGFLGILESVVGFGMQLGSIGAFGKTVAGRLNKTIPAYANGTSFHPGGIALVGERGPELLNMPRGSRVTPNNQLGGGNTYHFSGNLMTPEFWAQIQAGDAAAARSGAASAQSAMMFKQSRQV